MDFQILIALVARQGLDAILGTDLRFVCDQFLLGEHPRPSHIRGELVRSAIINVLTWATHEETQVPIVSDKRLKRLERVRELRKLRYIMTDTEREAASDYFPELDSESDEESEGENVSE